MNDVLELVRDWIGRRVAEGYDTDADILAGSVEMFGDVCDAKKLTPLAAHCTAELLAQHRQQQESWPALTDCDLVDTAFADLEAAGLLVRPHFSCCVHCARFEIDEELGQFPEVAGYAFFTREDTENATENGRLVITFGATASGWRAAVNIGQRIVAALRRAGLQADWDGHPDRPVVVFGLDWKRRR